MAKHSTDILTWARRGAEARWNELQAEAAALLKAFQQARTPSEKHRARQAMFNAGVGWLDDEFPHDALEP